MLVYHAKWYTGLKPRKGRSLNTSNLKEEINCFERTGLNGLYPNTGLLPFIESKAIEGERGSTYWCMSTVLNSLFFFSSRYFLLFFSFVLFPFLQCLLLVIVFPRNSYYRDFPPPPSAQQGVPYIEPAVISIYCFSLWLSLSGVGVLADHLLVVSCSATTTYLYWLCYSPLPNKEGYFVCLFVCRGFSTHYSVCALSLYPSLHAPSGSNSSLLLLCGMSSQ